MARLSSRPQAVRGAGVAGVAGDAPGSTRRVGSPPSSGRTSGTRVARANLRTALSAVREALGGAAATALVADRRVVGLAGPPDVVIDVSEFDALLKAGRAAEAIAVLGEGDVLPDLDFDWVFRERDRLRERGWRRDGTARGGIRGGG